MDETKYLLPDMSRWDEVAALIPRNLYHGRLGGRVTRGERDAMIYHILCEIAELEAASRE